MCEHSYRLTCECGQDGCTGIACLYCMAHKGTRVRAMAITELLSNMLRPPYDSDDDGVFRDAEGLCVLCGDRESNPECPECGDA